MRKPLIPYHDVIHLHPMQSGIKRIVSELGSVAGMLLIVYMQHTPCSVSCIS